MAPVVSPPLRGGGRESILQPQEGECSGGDGGMGSLHEGTLETPGVAVSARAGQRGGLFLEGGIRAPRHLGHPDSVPRGQNKKCFSLRWFHL